MQDFKVYYRHLLLCCFIKNRFIVSQKFLDLCLTTGVDAAKPKDIFEVINNTLTRFEIPWDNCVAFGIDNTNSNIGAKNSIKSRVTQGNPSIYFVGCPCHIIHNAAQKSAEAFLMHLWIWRWRMLHWPLFWFDKSTKWKGMLDKYATFCDTPFRGFIKHINVRWLSFENAVERILQMFLASSSYFRSVEMTEARFVCLRQLYEDPMFEIQLLFFQAVLPVFTTFNLFCQRDDPQIYILHNQMISLLKKLL